MLINEKLVEKLKELELKISVAESITGGFIANSIVSVAGASKIFSYGVVSYSNEAKINLLNVKELTLKRFGAISEDVAAEMAINIKKISNSDVSISTTGNCGPDVVEDKPAGKSYICIVLFNKMHRYVFESKEIERNAIRHDTAFFAISRLYDIIKDLKK